MGLGRFPLIVTIFGTILVGLVLIVFQSTLLKALLPDYLVPNLTLCLVIYLAFFRPSVMGAFLACILGLQLDLFASRAEIDQFRSVSLLGPYGAAFVLVYGVVSSFSQRLFLESKLTVIVVVGIASVISHFIYLLIISQFMRVGTLLGASVYQAPLEAIATMIATPLVFWLLDRVSLFIEIRDLRGPLLGGLREV